MTSPRLVVLAAGGTGGHVFPADALAAELAGRGCRLVLITDRRGGTLGGSLGAIETHRIAAGGLAGKSVAAWLRSGPELALGTVQARRLLKRLSPDAVVGFGGYASVPTMLAAALSGCHTAIHEQNAVLGRANRLFAARVERIATSFAETGGVADEARGKVVHTGMPVREAIVAMRERPYPALDGAATINLLVLGGSQGARVLSEVVPEAIARLDRGLRARLRVVQQCRREDLDRVARTYLRLRTAADLAPFFDDVPARLAAAHLVIARAGASTVAELTTVGRPSILVPYPHAVDDHQTFNAQAVDEAGAGWLLPEPDFTARVLAGRLDSLLAMPAVLEQAARCARAAGRPSAAAALADVVLRLLPAGGEPEAGRRAA